MIRENKWKLLISSVVILLPELFEFTVLPLFILLLHWICVLFTAMDPKNKGQNKKVFGIVIWITPMVSLFASGVMYAFASGKASSFYLMLMPNLLMGVVFIVIGNYLPKCKQNYTIGIKIKWTLENEENWNVTHRFAGKVWVIGGFLLLMSAFLPESMASVVSVVSILALVVIPVIYSYRYRKKQLREGMAVITPIPKNEISKTIKIVSGIMVMCILIAVAALMFTGDIEVYEQEDSFTIEASYWNDMTVAYDEIESIEYRDKDSRGSRIGGFGSARLLMGAFHNEEFGNYTRYSYTMCDACIVMTVNEKMLVISGRDAEHTKEIYEIIKMNME